jgi:hypothetical protein
MGWLPVLPAELVLARFRRNRNRHAWVTRGRGERSQTDRSDLNVPLALECEVVGMARWLERVR